MSSTRAATRHSKEKVPTTQRPATTRNKRQETTKNEDSNVVHTPLPARIKGTRKTQQPKAQPTVPITSRMKRAVREKTHVFGHEISIPAIEAGVSRESPIVIKKEFGNTEALARSKSWTGEGAKSTAGTQGDADEGSTRASSLTRSSRTLKRKRSAQEEEFDHESRKLRRRHNASITASILSAAVEDPLGVVLAERETTIASLEEELAYMRSAQADLQEAKSTLAKELHRLHLRGKAVRGQGFEGHEGGRGDSRAFEKALLDREGQDEIPTFIELPAGFSSTYFVDLPPMIVKCDRIETSLLQIRCEEAIGAGGSGRVIGGTIIAHRKKLPEEADMCKMSLAIKAVMKSGLPSWDADFFRESRVLKILGENGIAPRFVTAIETPTRLLLIMERYPMSLWELQERILSATDEERLSAQTIQVLARRLTRLVCRLHDSGHMHRDLKPDNVLVSESGDMVLADFGMTTRIGQRYEEDFGTSGFTIPFGKAKYNADPRVDIWSLGATILSLAGADFCLKPGPITEQDCQDAVEMYFPKTAQPKAHDFISKCLAFPKQGRKVMTAQRAAEHDWITEEVGRDIEECLSLSVSRAARENREILQGSNGYFLNIGEGPCRELAITA